MKRVFVLEDDHTRMATLAPKLIGCDVTHIVSATDVDKFQPPYDLVLLDHDLGGRQMDEHEDDGTAFVKAITEKFGPTLALGNPVFVCHSYNAVGACLMAYLLACADGNVRVAPFGGRLFWAILAGALQPRETGMPL